jgi:hypothetical protein
LTQRALRPTLATIVNDRKSDLVSWGVIVLAFVLLFVARLHLPVFSDSWYHLSVVRAFSERGVTGHAWWEFAPFGRPQLYSPLLHVIGVGLMRLTGCSLLGLATLYQVVTFPLLLLAGWGAARVLFGACAALVTVLLLLLNIGLLFPVSLIIMPGTYALMLWPYLAILVLRKNWLAGATLLAAMAYLHFGVATVAALSVVLMDWRMAARIVPLAAVAFSPWLIHLYRHREYLHSGVANLPVFIPVFTALAALAGVLALVRTKRKEAWVIGAMILASGLFLFTLRERFWTYGGFLFALLGGFGVVQFADKHLRWILPVLGISAISATPFLKPPAMKLALPVPFQSSPFLMGTPAATLLCLNHSEPVPVELVQLTDWIRQNVGPEEIIITDDRLLGECVFALTGRRTTAGLWSEVMTPALQAKLAEYKRTAKGFVVSRGETTEGGDIVVFGNFSVTRR